MSMSEEECRRYIIVFGSPCPCETDHKELTPEEALAKEIESVTWEHEGGELGQASAASAIAAHLMKHFEFGEKKSIPDNSLGGEKNA
jgi:glycine/serine hydroxymethyltransferase